MVPEQLSPSLQLWSIYLAENVIPDESDFAPPLLVSAYIAGGKRREALFKMDDAPPEGSFVPGGNSLSSSPPHSCGNFCRSSIHSQTPGFDGINKQYLDDGLQYPLATRQGKRILCRARTSAGWRSGARTGLLDQTGSIHPRRTTKKRPSSG